MRSNLRPGAVIAGLSVSLVLLLSGCGAITLAPVAPDEQSIAPATLDAFYAQSAEWQPCESEGLECATLVAPLDYSEPAAGVTELALIRKPSSGTPLGSLFLNPGGPGGSGFDFVLFSEGEVAGAALQENYDIVGWDPRGVGRSDRVACYDAAGMDDYLYGVAENPVGSDAWFEEKAADGAAFAAACAAGTGELLGHIDAISTARDLDLMRAVLGDEKLNYLGFSYGTVFGAQYAELFPDRVGRVVLDGAVDPALGPPETFPVQMAGFDAAYRAFLDFCLVSDGCPFTGSLDDAIAQSSALFAGVDERALMAADGRQLTSPTLGTALAFPLYDEGSWGLLVDMLAGLVAGDPSIAFSFADAYNGRSPAGTYESNSTEVYTAALCLDGVFSDGPDGTRSTLAAIEAAAPITGRYLAYSDWVVVDAACRSWPFDPALEARSVTASGAAPILVVGATNDPATPYSWAQSLAGQLESGVLVTRRGEGHTSYASGNACIDAAVDDYFVSGTVPSTDPLC